MNKDKHYRYCFSCDKWLSKQEVNEIDGGEQPGNKSGKSWNCQYCKKDLGDQIQIFNCPNHEDIILKVGGTLDGENKEKIFYDTCPKEGKQQPSQPGKGNEPSAGTIAIGVLGAIIIVGAIGGILYAIFKGDERKEKEPGKA